MAKTRSRRPSSETRPARRSLAELGTAMNRAVDDGLRVTPAAAPAAALAAEVSSPLASAARDDAVSDSAAEMMVQIAKDYQNGVLDGIRAGLNAALDRARDFAETKRPDDAVSENDVRTAMAAATAKFRTQALQLMQANFAGGIDYARDLAGAKTAADFVELSGTQARKSCELMLKQAEMLRSLARAVAKERDDCE